MDLSSQTHCIITTLKIPTPQQITCLIIHNNLLYAASVNKVNVFDLSNYTHLTTFTTKDPISSGSIKSIAFHNSRIFTAHQDSKIRVWRIQTNASNILEHRHVSTLPTVKDRLYNFIIPSNYVNVRRHKKRLWIEHWDAVSVLVVHGGLMYSASWDKSFKVWDVKKKEFNCLESIVAHEDAVNSLVVSCDGRVYTGSADGVIRVWDKVGDNNDDKKNGSHSLVSTLEKKHKSTVNALALTKDGSLLLSGGGDGSVLVWEKGEEEVVKGMVFVKELLGHSGAVLCLANVLDGWMVSGSSDRTVRVWERRKKGEFGCLLVLEGHERPVKSLAVTTKEVSSNGSFVICSGSFDGEIKVWEVSATAKRTI